MGPGSNALMSTEIRQLFSVRSANVQIFHRNFSLYTPHIILAAIGSCDNHQICTIQFILHLCEDCNTLRITSLRLYYIYPNLNCTNPKISVKHMEVTKRILSPDKRDIRNLPTEMQRRTARPKSDFILRGSHSL